MQIDNGRSFTEPSAIISGQVENQKNVRLFVGARSMGDQVLYNAAYVIL